MYSYFLNKKFSNKIKIKVASSKRRAPLNYISSVSIGLLHTTHCLNQNFDVRFSMSVTTPSYEVSTTPIGTKPWPIDGAHRLDEAPLIWILFEIYLLRK